MTDCREHICRADRISGWLKSKLGNFRPQIAAIMGSGLSDCVPPLEDKISIPYDSIDGFPKSSVSGHAGNLLFGKYNGLGVAVMQGRFHYYEGHELGDIALVVRVLGELGVKTLIATAAVGSLRKTAPPGSLVVLSDHINLMGANPLRGVYDKRFGPMFTDMSAAYDPELRRETLALCKNLGIHASEGVYIASPGPSYETPAEVRAYGILGADVVGMSTVPEVIAARQLGMRVLGLSWVTNLASGIAERPLSHQEVLEEGRKVADNFRKLLREILQLPLLMSHK
ncbi:MAG: purine-nucleoside phosphorylase [Elusimicrobiales bacterium]